MNDMTQTGFDYAAMPVESVDRLKTWKTEIAAFTDTVESSLVQIGLRFQKAQDELNRQGVKGEGFAVWVKNETVYSLSNAYELINVADKFKDQPLPKFGRSVLYALAAPSTPESVVEQAIAKTESGGKVTVADVKDWKAELDVSQQRCEEFRQESNIKLRLKRTVEDIIEIGRELTAVKADLPHGQFLPWIEAEFEMSEWTARQFMHAAERFGDKSEIISDFKPTILYALAAPSTPDSVVEKAMEKAETGAKITIADVKDWKAELDTAQQRCEEFRQESIERRKTIRTLEEQIALLTTRDAALQGRAIVAPSPASPPWTSWQSSRSPQHRPVATLPAPVKPAG